MIVPAVRLLFPVDVSPEEQDLLSAALQDYSPSAVHEVSDREWRVFFRAEEDRDAALQAPIYGRASAAPLDVPDEDWARRSQEALRAIVVGRLTIAPPWDEGLRLRPARGGDHAIVIEPSTGFGTGHHATTRLCLRALQRIGVEGRSVLDVGTGSGVLAIAAAVLGASSVVAIDNDPDAIAAARANVERNRVAVDLRLGDLAPGLPRADVVVANLTGAALRRHAPVLLRLATRTLVLSGVLADEADEVRGAFAPAAAAAGREDEDGWVAFVITIA